MKTGHSFAIARLGLGSRRQFLRRGALVSGAVLALPQCLPPGVLAADGRPGANDRIRIGFVGIGRQASALLAMLPAIKETQVVVFADVNLRRAQAAGAPLQADSVQEFRRVLDRRDVDAIVTATPEHWRASICIQACQAGKDIYAEKPLTLTVRDGRLMVQAARKYNRIFQTGSQQRSMWPNRCGCDLVRSGALGRIQRVIAHNYPSPWYADLPAQPVPADLDWNQWCGPTEPVPYHEDLYLPRARPGWLSFRPYSGGEMTGWGSHGLDQVQWALGMDEAGPVEVWTEGPAFEPPTYREPEAQTRGDQLCNQPKVFMRYPGDIVMELGDGPTGGAVFVGEKARLTIDRGVCKSDPADLAADALERRPAGFVENHLRQWVNCIKTRTRPVADVEIGHRSATVCHLANIARWTGRRLRWDPVREEFAGDAEANALLTRTRRKGFELPAQI